jgi:transposase InsO family protein
MYSVVPQMAVIIFIRLCPICSKRVCLKPLPCGKPIISRGLMERVQIDLIDMRSRPDGDYKWIAHAKDHFSKFSWATALHVKEAKEVALFLLEIFRLFGPPLILQSDNGKEFVAKIIQIVAQYWDIQIINGRPRHPENLKGL